MTGIADMIGLGTPGELRLQLRTWLDTEIEVSDRALAAVVSSPRYAQKLGSVRPYPDAVRHLLENPPEVPLSVLKRLKGPSNKELVTKAGKSITRWMSEGLRQVEKDVRERRWAACKSCPNLADPPNKLAYKIAGAVSNNRKICSLCGCNVRTKGRFPHEACPETHPDDNTQTRWMEPVAPATTTD